MQVGRSLSPSSSFETQRCAMLLQDEAGMGSNIV